MKQPVGRNHKKIKLLAKLCNSFLEQNKSTKKITMYITLHIHAYTRDWK